jgi:hypothetical protein
MDLGSVFLLIAISLMVVLFVSRPLMVSSTKAPISLRSQEGVVGQQHSTLLAERERVMNALGELDFDHALGKVPQEDYPSLREVLLMAGARILRQLDQGGSPQAVDANVPLQVIDKEDDLEKLIAARRRSHHEKTAGFCPQCGNPVQKSDKYCFHCGRTQG